MAQNLTPTFEGLLSAFVITVPVSARCDRVNRTGFLFKPSLFALIQGKKSVSHSVDKKTNIHYAGQWETDKNIVSSCNYVGD